MMDQARATYNTMLATGKEHYLPIAKDLMNQAQTTGYTILTNGKELALPIAKDLFHKTLAKDPKVLGAAAACVIGSAWLGWKGYNAFRCNEENWKSCKVTTNEDSQSLLRAFAKHVCTWKKTAVVLLAAGGTAFALHKKHPLGIAVSVYTIAAFTLSLVPYYIGFCVHAIATPETEIDDPASDETRNGLLNFDMPNRREVISQHKINTFLQALMNDANSENRKGICIYVGGTEVSDYDEENYIKLTVSQDLMDRLSEHKGNVTFVIQANELVIDEEDLEENQAYKVLKILANKLPENSQPESLLTFFTIKNGDEEKTKLPPIESEKFFEQIAANKNSESRKGIFVCDLSYQDEILDEYIALKITTSQFKALKTKLSLVNSCKKIQLPANTLKISEVSDIENNNAYRLLKAIEELSESEEECDISSFFTVAQETDETEELSESGEVYNIASLFTVAHETENETET